MSKNYTISEAIAKLKRNNTGFRPLTWNNSIVANHFIVNQGSCGNGLLGVVSYLNNYTYVRVMVR